MGNLSVTHLGIQTLVFAGLLQLNGAAWIVQLTCCALLHASSLQRSTEIRRQACVAPWLRTRTKRSTDARLQAHRLCATAMQMVCLTCSGEDVQFSCKVLSPVHTSLLKRIWYWLTKK